MLHTKYIDKFIYKKYTNMELFFYFSAYLFLGTKEKQAQRVSLTRMFRVNPKTRGLRLSYPYIVLYIRAYK